MACGRATAEPGSDSAATNYREEHCSEHNESPSAPGQPADQVGFIGGAVLELGRKELPLPQGEIAGDGEHYREGWEWLFHINT